VDLEFKDFIQKIEGSLGKEEWVVIYSSKHEDFEWTTFYACLISEDNVPKSLKEPSWDLKIGDGKPGIICTYNEGKEECTYYQYPRNGVQPLLIDFSFYGIKDDYRELSEEFRTYFGLYEEKKNGRFILIDDNGDEEEVAVITPSEVKIKLRLIKKFISLKKMRLAIFFDATRFSTETIEELGLKERHEKIEKDDHVYSIGVRNSEYDFRGKGIKSQSWLMGKKLVSGIPNFEPKLFDDENKEFEKFIIGVDEDGNEKVFTSDESELSNYFGANPGAPHFLTPVFFRREVLGKYYDNPDKYSVEDGYIRCGGMWGLRLDNSHNDRVMVFLGDLGHLSHKEQQYWRSFNISSHGISHTAWERSFMGEFSDPDVSDLFFKQRYADFQKKWKEEMGWDLFRPLSKQDEHHLKSLHIPLTNSQQEFDTQVLSLTKLMIDSINEAELVKHAKPAKPDAKGIDKFEAYLVNKGVHSSQMIGFMRNLQELRSTGVAHLKGSGYEKVKKYFQIDEKPLSEVFDDILVKAIWVFNTLSGRFLSKDD